MRENVVLSGVAEAARKLQVVSRLLLLDCRKRGKQVRKCQRKKQLGDRRQLRKPRVKKLRRKSQVGGRLEKNRVADNGKSGGSLNSRDIMFMSVMILPEVWKYNQVI